MTAIDSGAVAQGEGAAAPAKPSVDLPADATNWLALIRDCDRQIKDLEEAKALARGHLERMLGDAELGLVDGRPAVHWTVVVSNRFDSSAFKRSRPDLYSEFVAPQTSRRFTLAADGDR